MTDPHITLRPCEPERDAAMLHAWLTHPRSAFWDMLDASPDDVLEGYRRIHASEHENAWIGELAGEPVCLVETYDPARHPLSHHVEILPADLGMHLLVAPPTGASVPGLTSAAMRAAVSLCFSLGARRVVVEPDVRNTAVHVKNAEVGFTRLADVDLADKRAAISVCTREDFHRATSASNRAWDAADRLIVAKALGEFAHELLITPRQTDDGSFVLDADEARWTFRAHRYALDHWHVLPGSVRRCGHDGTVTRGTSSQLVLDLREALGLDGELLTTYLEELGATVAHRVRTSEPGRPTSRELIDAPAHVVEAAMSEGHPCFVATNARIGFSAEDLARFTPEASQDVRPLWAAVPREHSHLAVTAGLDEQAAYDRILGSETHAHLRERMAGAGLDPDEHRLLPLHPWQWDERIRTTFAEDVARRRIVVLEEDPDAHRPAQSIRTWIDVDEPHRPYVKMALAIRNMGFVRGLSPAYMRSTPAINDYVADLVRSDETLRAAHFDVLTEFASIGYTGDLFHRADLTGPPTRMIAALWRESPAMRLAALGPSRPVGPAPGSDENDEAASEQLMTMAALLHRDAGGRALVSELIAASETAPAQWLRRYLDAYVIPIVHLLCAHRLAFIPHGENVILRLRGHVVTGVFLKDIGEEVGLMDDGTLGDRLDALPGAAGRIHTSATSEEIALGLFTDVFDGFLRFLAPIFVEDGLLDEVDFWNEVDAALADYEAAHPTEAASLPLRTPRFARSCLNRLQLRNPLEMVRLDDTVGSLIMAGELDNPIGRSAGMVTD